jgi:hypothetical protein
VNIQNIPIPISSSDFKIEASRLLPEKYHLCLDGKDPYKIDFSKITLLGSFYEEHLKGLSLSLSYPSLSTGEILYLTVDKDVEMTIHLLRETLVQLKEVKNRLVLFKYIKENLNSSLIENACLQNFFKGPNLLKINCFFYRSEFNPDWLYKNLPLPTGFEIQLWASLNSRELERLKNHAEQRNVPNAVWPFQANHEKIETRNSLVLKYKGDVVGWMITHRINPDEIRYGALYIDQEFNQTGLWLNLLADALKIHCGTLTDITYGSLEMNVEQIPTRWYKFVERRLFKHAHRIEHEYEFWKEI